MADYSIESGVPMPEKLGNRGRSSVFPFRQMKVGDSFFRPGDCYNRAKSAAYAAAKKIGGGVKFSCRKVEGGVRIWRVA